MEKKEDKQFPLTNKNNCAMGGGALGSDPNVVNLSPEC